MTYRSNNRRQRKALHERVTEKLRQNVLARLHPGVKLDSEAQLARQLRVSVHTLRQALSVLAHEGLIERRHGSGTYSTDHRKQKAVAVATANYPGQIVNSFQLRLFFLLVELFQRHGYRCRSYTAPVGFAEGWTELIEDIQRGRIAGAAFVAMDASSANIPLAKYDVPYLQWDGPHGSVVLDGEHLLQNGVHHLLERGCRRMALMQWTGNIRQGHDVFRSTLTERGVPIREEWIRRTVPPETPGAGWE